MTKARMFAVIAAVTSVLAAGPLAEPASARSAASALRVLLSSATSAAPSPQAFAPGASYQVCFTPGGDCTSLIVSVIDAARSSVRLQAYSFTSAPIAQAIVAAKKRGLLVEAVLDKSQRTERYSGATFLANAGIPVVIDEQPAIAHNKVIIVDAETRAPAVVTGSFNFTKSAQEKNAENVFVIRDDPRIAAAYAANFRARQSASVRF